MSSDRKTRIVSAFDRAKDYATHAHIQRTVADRLAKSISALEIDMAAPALEIGCGTGFLTEVLLDRWPELPLIITDIAPAMVERARGLLTGPPHIRFEIMDGEHPVAQPGSLGLIVSSLAFQWFETPAESISRLIETLRPGGWLIFSTLAAGSFREWAAAQRSAGLAELTPDYPEAAILEQMVSPGCRTNIHQYNLTQHHADGIRFLRSLKAIGAGARWRASPASPSALRQAISLFEQQGSTISYEIAEVAIQRMK